MSTCSTYRTYINGLRRKLDLAEFEPIAWAEFDDDIDDNEERAKNIIQKYRFDFDKIPKQEIVELIHEEIENYQEGSSEYIRVLCGYLYCIGTASDAELIKKAKYEINFDVESMIDREWIDSLSSDDADGQRNAIIQYFVEYYHSYLEE